MCAGKALTFLNAYIVRSSTNGQPTFMFTVSSQLLTFLNGRITSTNIFQRLKSTSTDNFPRYFRSEH
jgi:hypothetical protein